MVWGGGGEGKKVMEASQVVVRQVPRSICTVADDRHCPRGSVPDSRVPLSHPVPLSPRVGTRIYYSAACFTSGAETMVKTRVETWASPRTVRGPLLLVDLPPPPPLASFLSSTQPAKIGRRRRCARSMIDIRDDR